MGFPSQFQKDGLQMSCCPFGDNPSHPGRSSEIDMPNRRMVYKRANDFARICGIVGEHIDRAVRKAGFLEDRADEPMDSRQASEALNTRVCRTQEESRGLARRG